MQFSKIGVFLDFDNTVYNREKNTILQQTKDSIDMARKRGVKVFLLTGRNMASVQELDCVKGLHLDAWSCVNGQEIYDENFKLLFSKTISRGDCEQVLKFAHNHGEMGVIASTNKGFVFHDKNKYSDVAKMSLNRLKDQYNLIFTEGDIRNCEVFNFSLITDTGLVSEHEFKLFEKDLREEDNKFTIIKSHPCYFDIILKDFTKAVGVKHIVDKFGLEYTYGIGDAPNDIDMLKAVDFPVGMGNSDEETRKYCQYITTSIEEDGVGNFIRNHILTV